MDGIYLLLGTNLADREKNLTDAFRYIETHIGRILMQSPVYETAAWGIRDQPAFLNQAIRVESSLSPEDLLNKILFIEIEMGRQRFEKWGSRLIDIDILFYNDEYYDTPQLKIPHPEFKKRNFALVPMAEIAPLEYYPGTSETMSSLKEISPDTLPVRRMN